MKRFLLIFGLFSTLGAGSCLRSTEYVSLPHPVPDELLQPVPISDRTVETYRDLAILATEHLNSATQANLQIVAIGRILNPGTASDD